MARPKFGRGLFHTRDSGGKHEMTPGDYLRWANMKAVEFGVSFCVPDDTIAQMVKNRQSVYGDVYLDYDVCGNLLSRPALDALKARILADESISHLFIPRRDRLSRPNEATDGLLLELWFRRAGVTIVFMDKVLPPLSRGERVDISDMITGVVDYHKSGQDRRDLADKIINAQLSLARAGFTTGGRPCYGFRRWLVKLDGTKVRQLDDGERVRMAGHHVVWLPVSDDHPEMVLIRRIRESLKSTPGSRVAKLLTEEGIPSPDTGRTRHDCGIEHVVSGVWSQTTVMNIGRNELLAAVCKYGQRSMGDQLRFTPDGPRMLTDDDFRKEDGKPKVVRNAVENVHRTTASFEPVIAPEHAELQVILDRRSTSQRGKPRSKDPNNNPLGARIFDMNCGWPMYRAPYANNYHYTCGFYHQSKGAKCAHNHVDGPVAALLIMNCIAQKVLTPNGTLKLRTRLAEIAAAEKKQPVIDPSAGLRLELTQVRAEQAKVERNLALAESPEQRKAVARIFDENVKRIANLEEQLQKASVVVRPIDSQSEVDAAMAALNRLPELLNQPDNMPAVRAAVNLVDAKIYLAFEPRKWKKKNRQQSFAGPCNIR